MFTWTITSENTKGPAWYTIAGVFSLSLIIWGFFVGLYAMSIVIFIFVGVYMLMENNAPESVQIGVDENGINIGGNFYDYPKIEEFSIVYDNKIAILLRLKTKKRGMHHIDIDLTRDVNPAELRSYLAQYIVESENGGELTSSERLMRFLKV